MTTLQPPEPPADLYLQPRWTQKFRRSLVGLSLAREKCWLLTWDDAGTMHLLDRNGQRQGQVALDGLTMAASADDGSAFAAASPTGNVWYLTPDLRVRWQRVAETGVRSLAIEPFGSHVAVSTSKGALRLFDGSGQTLWTASTPRPLLHLAFVPAKPLLVGAADFGLVIAVDPSGNTVWRDGVVTNIGSLAVNGDGSGIVLSCFGQGLIRYGADGAGREQVGATQSFRYVCCSFAGDRLAVTNLHDQVMLLDRQGQVLTSYSCDQPITALAISALGDEVVSALADGTLTTLKVSQR